MRPRSFLFTIAVSVALSGCAHPTAPATPVTSTNSVAPTLTGDPAHPGQTSGWVDTRLYFGLGPADRPEKGISESQWRDFLDKEVTPQFPDGLSVIDIYGQWRVAADSTTLRERSKLLNIVYPDNAENAAKIDAIRAAWKKITGDQSVLKVTEPADVSF